MTKPNYKVELKNFFIFNSNLGTVEGQELLKILYYYPVTENTEIQIKNVGLIEGIIQFTGTFKPSKPVSCVQTKNSIQVYAQVETDFWIILTLNIVTSPKAKEDNLQPEYKYECMHESAFHSLIQMAYSTYKLFWNTFESAIASKGVPVLKTQLETFFNTYLRFINVNEDISKIFLGIQYLPLNREIFLKVQCFLNTLESTFQFIKYTIFIFSGRLIWSGLEPSDTATLYQYMLNSLLLLSDDRKKGDDNSPFANLHQGRFVTKFKGLQKDQILEQTPLIFLHNNGTTATYYMLLYKAFEAVLCLFIPQDQNVQSNITEELHDFINPALTGLVISINDYGFKELHSHNTFDTIPKYMYFNQMNLAYKSTLNPSYLESMPSTSGIMSIIADIYDNKQFLGHVGEVFVKAMDDYWIVAKLANMREFYIILQHKDASLNEISREVKALYDTEFKGIFLHPL